jgi:squalene cyclase
MASKQYRNVRHGVVVLALTVAIGVQGLMPARALAAEKPLPDLMDKATVDTIDKGLNYLAKTQRPDGQWYPSGGYGSYPTTMTALAGLAFIAGGSTPESGPYAKNVRKAMHWILRLAETEKDGLIAGSAGEGRSMYGHGFALLFLAQCYGMDLDEKTEKRLRDVLEKAVKITARSQSKTTEDAGGWIYTPDGSGDEGSVTVTQLQALRAARNVGIEVPKSCIDKAVKYLKISQNADGGISYSYQSRGSSRPAISAAAIACFYAAGVYDRDAGGKGAEAEMVAKLVKYVQGRINVDGSGDFSGHYFYTHLYYAEALYQRAGNDWKDYYPKMAKRLISMQSPDGSWNGDGVGTTYGTAIATIILQLPYGYLPVCQR